MSPFIPVWIIGGPFIGLLILAFSFKGASAMGGSLPRVAPRDQYSVASPTSLADPIYPNAPRRNI